MQVLLLFAHIQFIGLGGSSRDCIHLCAGTGEERCCMLKNATISSRHQVFIAQNVFQNEDVRFLHVDWILIDDAAEVLYLALAS
jgi:hypothetical protein